MYSFVVIVLNHWTILCRGEPMCSPFVVNGYHSISGQIRRSAPTNLPPYYPLWWWVINDNYKVSPTTIIIPLFLSMWVVVIFPINYIMETFPIVKRKDEHKYGRYRFITLYGFYPLFSWFFCTRVCTLLLCSEGKHTEPSLVLGTPTSRAQRLLTGERRFHRWSARGAEKKRPMTACRVLTAV